MTSIPTRALSIKVTVRTTVKTTIRRRQSL